MGRLQDIAILASFAIGTAIVLPGVFISILKNK